MSELDGLIHFWMESLVSTRILLNPSTINLVEQTIKYLNELKKIKEA